MVDGGAMTDTGVWDRLERLLEFPVVFPIKVMGRPVPGFAQTIADLACQHCPDFDPGSMQMRPSSRGGWLSLTLNVRAQSRVQLEQLYRALATHPLVRVVL
jgi:putative lipoic acid-binding regulatory protein